VDLATARARLERMLQWDVAPVLTSAEVTDLLLMARRPDANGYVAYDTWAASTLYPLNDYRTPVVSNGYFYYVQTPGTSGATEPAWPTTSGGTVTDGSVVWALYGPYYWAGVYDLRAAAAEGWRWKAGKVAGETQAALGNGVQFYDNQQIEHCLKMAQLYSGASGSGGLGSVRLTRSDAPRWRY
jgi:hypothetical protein